jgi:tetratricopeptide (TPR) repeat protein
MRLAKVESAVELLRRAQLRYPSDFWIQHRLGEAFTLLQPPRHDLAARCFAAAIAIRPDNTSGYSRLSYSILEGDHNALGSKELLRRAIEIRPTDGEAYMDLFRLCLLQGDYREAIGYKEKVAKYAGVIVETWGLFDELKLEERLKAVVPKVDDLRDEDLAAMAGLCKKKGLNRLSSDLYRKALDASRKQASPPGPDLFFEAACASCLTSNSQGDMAGAFNDKERSIYRRRALDWLGKGLDEVSEGLGDRQAVMSGQIVQSLRGLQLTPDLACIRDEAELAKLPSEERAVVRSLWERLATVLSRVGSEQSR